MSAVFVGNERPEQRNEITLRLANDWSSQVDDSFANGAFFDRPIRRNSAPSRLRTMPLAAPSSKQFSAEADLEPTLRDRMLGLDDIMAVLAEDVTIAWNATKS